MLVLVISLSSLESRISLASAGPNHIYIVSSCCRHTDINDANDSEEAAADDSDVAVHSAVLCSRLFPRGRMC